MTADTSSFVSRYVTARTARIDRRPHPGPATELHVPRGWNGDIVYHAHGIRDVLEPVEVKDQDESIAIRESLGARARRVSVELLRFDDVGEFLELVEPALIEREAEHSLLLGAALALRSAGSDATPAAPYLAAAVDRDGLAVAALLTGSRPFALATDRDDDQASIDLLADDLLRAEMRPTGAHGRVGVAARFARTWGAAAGADHRIAMRQRLHALTELRPVPIPPGELRPARSADLPLLTEWMVAFEREALGEVDVERRRTAAARRLGAGELYVWDDAGPRSMAAKARPTRGTIAVNAVYTPPEQRGRGFATACVARLSARLLAEGRRQCVLFTDLANPTSNAIYARIGYRGVADFELCRFDYRER